MNDRNVYRPYVRFQRDFAKRVNLKGLRIPFMADNRCDGSGRIKITILRGGWAVHSQKILSQPLLVLEVFFQIFCGNEAWNHTTRRRIQSKWKLRYFFAPVCFDKQVMIRSFFSPTFPLFMMAKKKRTRDRLLQFSLSNPEL